MSKEFKITDSTTEEELRLHELSVMTKTEREHYEQYQLFCKKFGVLPMFSPFNPMSDEEISKALKTGVLPTRAFSENTIE